MKAEDFVLAFKRICDSHIVSPLAYAFIEGSVSGTKEYNEATKKYAKDDFSRYDKEELKGVKALDDLTLRITLNEPSPILIYALAMSNFAPFPKEIIDFYIGPFNESLPATRRNCVITGYKAMAGTGPYVVESFETTKHYILVKNPLFREEFYPKPPDLGKLDEAAKKAVQADIDAGLYQDAGKRLPLIDKFILVYVPESEPAWKIFMEGKTDVSGIPQDIFKKVVSVKGELLPEFAKQNLRLIKYSDPSVYWLGFNLDDPVLGKSKSLRQAMSLAFDRQKYLDDLFNGRGVPAKTCVPDGFEGSDRASPYGKYDLKAAKAKMDDARKELIVAGVIKDGDEMPTLTLDLGGRDLQEQKMGEFCQKQFEQIGLKLEVVLNDWPTLLGKVEKGKTQMYATGWHADYPDSENFLQLYYSPNIKNQTNQTRYSNPAFDKLYEQAVKMNPSAERAKLYGRMLDILNEDCPVLLLTEPLSYILARDWVCNFKPYPIGNGFLKYRRIDVEKRNEFLKKNAAKGD